MAKELPYYKFHPAEWIKGDITLCSMETQGVFINLCSYYWLKDCSISLANAKQRFSKNVASLDELLDSGIILIDENENVIINFLDEQMQEFSNINEKRVMAGRLGGLANAKQMLSKRGSKTVAKPSNKDKIREEKNIDTFYQNELNLAEENEYKDKYKKLVDIFFGKNGVDQKMINILSLPKQLTFEQFKKLLAKTKDKNISLIDIFRSMENWKDLKKKNTDVYYTANNWINREK